MGRRHDEDRELKPPKEVRAKSHRQVRHHVTQDLHVAGDADDVILPVPVAERRPRKAPKPRRMRHWKLKSWKRRTNEQRARNAATAALNEDED